jgi:hypothetical protein
MVRRCETDDMESIAECLKLMRKSFNPAQGEISRQLGIAQTACTLFDIGVKPRELPIKLICDKFEADKNRLTTGAKSMAPNGAVSA